METFLQDYVRPLLLSLFGGTLAAIFIIPYIKKVLEKISKTYRKKKELRWIKIRDKMMKIISENKVEQFQLDRNGYFLQSILFGILGIVFFLFSQLTSNLIFQIFLTTGMSIYLICVVILMNQGFTQDNLYKKIIEIQELINKEKQ